MKRSRFLRIGGIILATGCVVYALVYVDLIFRAREAYLEGEKYLEWNAHPDLKKAYYDKLLADKEEKINANLKSGHITVTESQEQLALAHFEEKERLSESSLKYAYVWFQTAVQLFSPPDSRWVEKSRLEMPRTLALWKQELDLKRIPYQDYMFQ